eukprot:scaffold38308_cov67-Phaeocystis_antarctica.AAC.2
MAARRHPPQWRRRRTRRATLLRAQPAAVLGLEFEGARADHRERPGATGAGAGAVASGRLARRADGRPMLQRCQLRLRPQHGGRHWARRHQLATIDLPRAWRRHGALQRFRQCVAIAWPAPDGQAAVERETQQLLATGDVRGCDHAVAATRDWRDPDNRLCQWRLHVEGTPERGKLGGCQHVRQLHRSSPPQPSTALRSLATFHRPLVGLWRPSRESGNAADVHTRT